MSLNIGDNLINIGTFDIEIGDLYGRTILFACRDIYIYIPDRKWLTTPC
jgi:hypothetical protein